MSRTRRPTTLAQPPWTYAPKEVSEWLSSGVERPRRGTGARPRVVTETVVRCTPHVGRRALRRFDTVVEGAHLRKALGIVPISWAADRRNEIREGRHSGVSVRLTTHWRAEEVMVRLRFRPPLSRNRAHRLLTQLGLAGHDAVVL